MLHRLRPPQSLTETCKSHGFQEQGKVGNIETSTRTRAEFSTSRVALPKLGRVAKRMRICERQRLQLWLACMMRRWHRTISKEDASVNGRSAVGCAATNRSRYDSKTIASHTTLPANPVLHADICEAKWIWCGDVSVSERAWRGLKRGLPRNRPRLAQDCA
jgi:hypothetical protein